jgi:hypothetical protein
VAALLRALLGDDNHALYAHLVEVSRVIILLRIDGIPCVVRMCHSARLFFGHEGFGAMIGWNAVSMDVDEHA